MIHLNDFEGLPPLPLVVDDELITARGAFDQQPGTISYMMGFHGCVQLFPLLAEVLVRSRRLAVRQREDRPLTTEEVDVELAWEKDLRQSMDGIIAALPPQLRADWLKGGPTSSDQSHDAILGMQRANIFVTDVSLRICLVGHVRRNVTDIQLDYISEIVPASDEIVTAKASLARRAYEALSGFPLDDLAANGESIVSVLYRLVIPDTVTAWKDISHSHGHPQSARYGLRLGRHGAQLVVSLLQDQLCATRRTFNPAGFQRVGLTLPNLLMGAPARGTRTCCQLRES